MSLSGNLQRKSPSFDAVWVQSILPITSFISSAIMLVVLAMLSDRCHGHPPPGSKVCHDARPLRPALRKGIVVLCGFKGSGCDAANASDLAQW